MKSQNQLFRYQLFVATLGVLLLTVPMVFAQDDLDVSGVEVSAVTAQTAIAINDIVKLDFILVNPAPVGLNSLRLECWVDEIRFAPEVAPVPVVVENQPTPTPEMGVFGEIAPVSALGIDVDAYTGSFEVSQTLGAPTTQSGKIASTYWRATVEGATTLECYAEVVDANDTVQEVRFLPLTLNVAPAVTEVTPEAPVVVVEPTVIPPSSGGVVVVTQEVVVTTPDTTVPVTEPIVTQEVVAIDVPATPANMQVTNNETTTGSIIGAVTARGQITITLSNANGVVQTVNTDATGNFTLADVAPGTYIIVADAVNYLPAQGVVSVLPATLMRMNPVALVAGDLNNDNLVINQADLDILNASYDLESSQARAQADIDGDGEISLSDLHLLADSFGKTGPSIWQ
jgi:hypothetical protein